MCMCVTFLFKGEGKIARRARVHIWVGSINLSHFPRSPHITSRVGFYIWFVTVGPTSFNMIERVIWTENNYDYPPYYIFNYIKILDPHTLIFCQVLELNKFAIALLKQIWMDSRMFALSWKKKFIRNRKTMLKTTNIYIYLHIIFYKNLNIISCNNNIFYMSLLQNKLSRV